MSYYAKTFRNKENKTEESMISQSSRPDQDLQSSRIPVKVLPTYIFSLKAPEKSLKLEKKESKKSLSRVQSSSKMLGRKSSLKSEKSLKSQTPLNPSYTDSQENPSKHSKSFRKKSGKPKEKKTLKSRTPLKSNINLSILIKAINDHCASCSKFKEELRKKNIELT